MTCCAGIGVLTVWAWPRSNGSWDSSAFRSSVVLPERYRPSVDSFAPAVMNNQSGNGMCLIEVKTTGTLGWSNHGGSQTSDPIFGTVCWSYPL